MGLLRTTRFALLAGGCVGVVGESWFRFLLSVAPGWTYQVAIRAVFDQVTFAPAVLCAVVAGTTALATADPDYVRHKVHHDGWLACGKMWALWLSGSAASYMLVPMPWQPPFAVGVSLLWSAYVSARTHRPTLGTVRRSEDLARKRDYLRDQRTVRQ